MTVLIKHSKVSTIPDTDDTSLVRPSDWNADHVVVGAAESGANSDITSLSGITGGISSPDYIQFDTAYSTPLTEGQLGWDGNDTLAVGMAGGNVIQHIGEDQFIYIKADAAITKGQVIMFTGAVGASGVLTGAPATGVTNPQYIMGIAAEDLAHNAFGLVQIFGELTGINTNSFNEGDVLYYDSAVTGGLTNVFPTSGPIVLVAAVAKKAGGNGTLVIRVSVTQRITAGAGATITQANTGTTVAVTNPYNPASVAITGGTINGTTIGATTASTGSFTTLNSTGGALNGTIGATTPATGKFTTLEATGTSTLGTASNQYLQAAGGSTEAQLSAQGAGTNIPLVLQPKGTGAIQAQATTSTTAGGNPRGANAVDWQTERGSAGQVASGSYATISGGRRGTASAGGAIVGGGWTNTASGTESAIVGGSTNTASGQWSFIGGGVAHTAAGFYNVIGGGFTNAGTSGSAVTTQATTTVTNGSTAVTLSGSNANIKVGQLVTGTGIAFPSYVSAISGTSLTLNQNATATGTPTLSFFTPHGVVVGGGNNQATGSYSFIGGGGDAGTAGNRNVASGDWSVVCGGIFNRATGAGSFIGGGGSDGTISGNTASNLLASVVGGRANNATANYSFVHGAVGNTASGSSSSVFGGSYATTRGIVGNSVTAASETPFGSFAVGQTQTATLLLGRQTTDATPTVLASNSSAAGTTNQVILPNNSAYFFTGEVVSGVTGGGNTKGWTIEGVIKRGANAASTALVGTPTVTSLYADAGAATWTIAVTADTTNGGLRVTFTGQAGTTIRTVCQIRTTEMTF